MRQEVKDKLAIWLFLPAVFSLLFITLLLFQKPPGRHFDGLEAASNPVPALYQSGTGAGLVRGVNDRHMPGLVFLNSGRRYTLPAGRKELNPPGFLPAVPEPRRGRRKQERGEHNSEGLENGGGLVRHGAKPRPHDCSVDDRLDELVEKIRQVESSGRANPPDGDGGKAVGPLQLHKCVIDDVNRWYGIEFSYADRRDLAKSKSIAKLYIAIWLQIYKEEIAARIFNGGPRGWRKKKTDKYWQKIQNVK